MENEETASVFEAEDQLESHSGQYFHWNSKIKHMQRDFIQNSLNLSIYSKSINLPGIL